MQERTKLHWAVRLVRIIQYWMLAFGALFAIAGALAVGLGVRSLLVAFIAVVTMMAMAWEEWWLVRSTLTGMYVGFFGSFANASETSSPNIWFPIGGGIIGALIPLLWKATTQLPQPAGHGRRALSNSKHQAQSTND